MGQFDEDARNWGDKYLSEGEPRRRKGRRGNANRLSLDEVKAMYIKGGGATRDAHMLGRKLRTMLVTLHCRYCGHDHLDTASAVDAMKYHPTCVKCGKPAEIRR